MTTTVPQPAYATYIRRPLPPATGPAAPASALTNFLGTELLNVQRGIRNPFTRTVTANYTLLTTDDVVLVDATAGAVTITFPDPTRAQHYTGTVKKIDNSAHAVTFATLIASTATAGTFDGVTSPALVSQYDARTMRSDGVAYYQAQQTVPAIFTGSVSAANVTHGTFGSASSDTNPYTFAHGLVVDQLTMTATASKIIPGSATFNVANHANTRNNFQIVDGGGMLLNFPTGEIGMMSLTVGFGTMPEGLQIGNISNVSGHRSTALFPSDGSPATYGAYYFTGAAVRTVWEYANLTGNNPVVFRVAPEGGETRFGDNFSNAGIASRIRIYGTSTANNGDVSHIMVVQQGGIATDTLTVSGLTTTAAVTASGLITTNGNLTVPSGKTLTVTGATVTGLTFPSLGGSITYAQLPSTGGTWNITAGTLVISGGASITLPPVVGTLLIGSLATFTNTTPFSVANGQTITASVTAQTVGNTTLTIPDFAGVSQVLLTTPTIGAANTVLTSSGSAPQWSTNIAYAALPIGSGSWDTGTGGVTTIAQGLTVAGVLTTNVDVNFTGGTTQVSLGNNTQATTVNFVFNTAAGHVREFSFRTAGLNRWLVECDASTESGMDTGSSFAILARHDDGTSIGTALSINRADMHATFGGMVIANAGITVANGQTFTMIGVTFAGVSIVSGRFGFTNATPFTMTNGQTLSVTQTAQTVGAATLTIPDFASVSDTFAFITKAQTFTNKTLTSPTLGGTVAGTPTWGSGQTFPTVTSTGVATFNADAKIGTVGFGLYVKEGTNATMGTATLVAGTVTVATSKVTANSRIFISRQNDPATLGVLPCDVTGRTAGTSFTVTSSSILDTAAIAWIIIEPA